MALAQTVKAEREPFARIVLHPRDLPPNTTNPSGL
jgi:hypothetical protein